MKVDDGLTWWWPSNLSLPYGHFLSLIVPFKTLSPFPSNFLFDNLSYKAKSAPRSELAGWRRLVLEETKKE